MVWQFHDCMQARGGDFSLPFLVSNGSNGVNGSVVCTNTGSNGVNGSVVCTNSV